LILLSSYERLIASRYLLPGKGERFIVLVAGFSLGAVMLGVAALVIVMSVMNGFRAELFDKIVGLNGHAVIQGYGGRPLNDWRQLLARAKATPGVTSAVPMIEQPLMMTNNGRAEAIILRGLTVPDIRGNPTIAGHVIAGALTAISGIIFAFYTNSVSPANHGNAYELRARHRDQCARDRFAAGRVVVRVRDAGPGRL